MGRYLTTLSLLSLLIALQGCSVPGKLISEEEMERFQAAARKGVLCALSERLLAPMAHRPLYSNGGGGACRAVDPLDPGRDGGALYGDPRCLQPITFHATSYADYCRAASDPDRLGNGDAIGQSAESWTLSPGGRFDLGTLSTAGNHHPYLLRTVYREVPAGDWVEVDGAPGEPPTRLFIKRGGGRCALEMRVYKSEPAARDLTPLLLFHGGSWHYRRYPNLIQESQLSHYTERGFVVFTPFYRLTGEGDASLECRRATWREITGDAEAALRWVEAHGGGYGASGERVVLAGQSAGGFLAAWLALTHPRSVARALLLYPALDLGEYLREVERGRITDPKGIQTMLDFLGVERRDQISVEGEAVRQTSLVTRMAAHHEQSPPLYLLHGLADASVPARQSRRMCGALGGDPEHRSMAQMPHFEALREAGRLRYRCGTGESRMELIEGAGHQFDLCTRWVDCPTDDERARAAVRDALNEALLWLAQ